MVCARTVSVNSRAPSADLIASANLPRASYFAELVATISRRDENVEVLVGGPAVGAGVVGGEVMDGSKEVAERLVGDALDLLELSAGGDDTALGGVVFGALLRVSGTAMKPTRAGAHAVGDRRGEVVAVADPAEVRQQDRLDGVIGAFERGGETETLLVLGQQTLAEDRTAEAVALVGDEDATAVRGREWYRLAAEWRVVMRTSQSIGRSR